MKLKGYSRPTRYKLGLCASIHHASTIDSFVDNKIDLPWRNFLSPEVRVKFQREVPLFSEVSYHEFPYSTVNRS